MGERAIASERAGILLCSAVGMINLMGSMYQWVSLETRTALLHHWDITCCIFSLFLTISHFLCYEFAAALLCVLWVLFLPLTTLRLLGLCAVSVWVCAPFCRRLFPSNVAFQTELRANIFLQGGNSRQPTNDGVNMMTLEDEVWRLQHLVIPQRRPVQWADGPGLHHRLISRSQQLPLDRESLTTSWHGLPTAMVGGHCQLPYGN